MKISTKGRYGLRILFDLALHIDKKPRLLRDIAESQNISEKYLSRLMIDLRQANLVESVRGAKGGYRIARNPSEISILEVIEVMEGTIAIVDCVECDNCKENATCSRVANCAVHEMWETINNKFRNSIMGITLHDIIRRQQELDADSQCWNYCI